MRCSGVELLYNFSAVRPQKNNPGKVGSPHTLQKSMLFTPLLPSAGPTGGEGDACPAPTISLTIWSFAIAFRAIMNVYTCFEMLELAEKDSEVFGVQIFRTGIGNHHPPQNSS
jgi:hypothetical protein